MASQRAVNVIKNAIEKLYPKELADSSWDNTGLILGAALDDDNGSNGSDKEPLSVLLTIDLTASVCAEALEKKSSMIMAYHPFIFRGLKSITTNDPQQKSLLRLARAGISVYCPHTAVDAAVGGVNDWLATALSEGKEESRVAVEKTSSTLPEHANGGMGRLITLSQPTTVSELISRAKKALGIPHVQAALAPRHRNNDELVKSIAICAGSGGSLLRGVQADLHFTGELGHHEALYLVETGTSAIVCGHSNTERGYLKEFREKLLKQLQQDYNGPVSVDISQTDRDPLETF